MTLDTTQPIVHFYDWLHDLTVLGYDDPKEIHIPATDKEIIDGYFAAGISPAEALEQYKKLKNL